MKKANANARHGRGFGTLEKRGGAFLARWNYKGRRYSQTIRTARRDEAERELLRITAPFRLGRDADTLATFKARIDENERAAAAMAVGVRVAGAIDLFERLDTTGRGETRADQIRREWAAFAKFAGVADLREITPETAAAFLSDFGRAHSTFSFNMMLSDLNAVWTAAARSPVSGIPETAKSPFAGIARRRVASVSRHALTLDELRTVCESARGELRLMFAIGLYTGLRLKDCALLDWGAVDLARRLISCTPAKTARYGKRVTVPIHPELLAMLSEIPADERRGPVLPQTAADYMKSRNTICTRVLRHFRACGIETGTDAPDNGRRRCAVGFHSLRHTFVSMAANAGAPLAVIQRIVGHSSASMTEHYYHETAAALQGAVMALPKLSGVADGANPAANAPSEAWAAFLAAAEAMTPDERGRAAAHLARLAQAPAVLV